MALNDNAVVTAAQGFVFVHDTPGAAAPTPTELNALDPDTFGAQAQTITVTGSPTGGSFTAKAATADSPVTIAYDATPAQVQTALESLASVGAGNTDVSGTSLASGVVVKFIGALQGQSPTLTLVGSGLTGGSTPAATASVTTAANGWKNIGHTSRDDMPEFGFDGGDTSVKGTWQKKRLREVQTGDPVADSVTIHLEQWDMSSLELYYGADTAATPGVFGVSGDFLPVEKALLIIVVDGASRIAFYSPKASIKRDDSIDMPVDGFSSLPVKATFLNLGTRRLFDWISSIFA